MKTTSIADRCFADMRKSSKLLDTMQNFRAGVFYLYGILLPLTSRFVASKVAANGPVRHVRGHITFHVIVSDFV